MEAEPNALTEKLDDAEMESEASNDDSLKEQEASVPDKKKEENESFIMPSLPPLFKKPSSKPKEVVKDLTVEEKTEKVEPTTDTGGSEETSKSSKTVPGLKVLPLPYKEPSWAGTPPPSYKLEVLKGGVLLDILSFDKSFIVFGRLPQCDVFLEHPSISRFHCILQYRAITTPEAEEGFYVYDLASTHGSYQNKNRLKHKVYNRMRVGHMLKFGGSSRSFLLLGPSEDEEEVSSLSVKELQEMQRKKLEEQALKKKQMLEQQQKKKEQEESKKDEGISWGMGADAEEEEGDDSVNPYSSLLQEELYLEDPKKSLKGWYEREGYDLPDYVVKEKRPGTHECTVTLPILSNAGAALIAVVEHKGTKKDCVVQCALEACRLLHKQGLFRQATHESRERKAEDLSSSDEDEYLDRTGDVERKRLVRKKKEVVLTYPQLKEQHSSILSNLLEICDKLVHAQTLKEELEKSHQKEEEDLEEYMRSISRKMPDKHKVLTWKLRCIELRKDEARLRRLTNVARPSNEKELLPPKLPENMKLPGEKTTETFKPSLGGITSKLGAPTAKRKDPPTSGVHSLFLEEDEAPKFKLTKLDSNEDFVPKAIPYASEAYVKHKVKRVDKASIKAIDNSKSRLPAKYVFETETKKENVNVADISEESDTKDSCAITIDNKTEEKEENKKEINEIEKQEDDKQNMNETEEQEENKMNETPVIVEDDKSVESDLESKVVSKKPRIAGPAKPTLEMVKSVSKKKSKKAPKTVKKVTDFVCQEETWLPPSGQTGDGKTHLNQRFGY